MSCKGLDAAYSQQGSCAAHIRTYCTRALILPAHVQNGSGSAAQPAGQQWRCLLRALPWVEYLMRCRGLVLRTALILSTYTAAAILAARLGTVQIAAHQVIQQMQQLQIAITWSLLSVGQTIVGSVFHDPDAGAAAARAIGVRVAFWSVLLACGLAGGTWAARSALPRLFVDGGGAAAPVLAAIAPAMAPACAMLAFSCNNGLEGVLLGAGDMRFVVGVYPWSVGLGLCFMAAAWHLGVGLTGIWWALASYYGALMVGFAARGAAPARWLRGPLHRDLGASRG